MKIVTPAELAIAMSVFKQDTYIVNVSTNCHCLNVANTLLEAQYLINDELDKENRENISLNIGVHIASKDVVWMLRRAKERVFELEVDVYLNGKIVN